MRILGNESGVQWQYEQALSVLRMLRVVEPHAQAHVVDMAACYSAMARPNEGMELLTGYLLHHPEAQEASRVGSSEKSYSNM